MSKKPDLTNLDSSVKEYIDNVKTYADDLIDSVKESSSTMVHYPYVLTATTNYQSEFEIPLGTFDKNKDAIIVSLNRSMLDINDYTLSGRVLTLDDASIVSEGDTLYLHIFKNTPEGIEDTISGIYLENDTVSLAKLEPDVRGILEDTENNINEISDELIAHKADYAKHLTDYVKHPGTGKTTNSGNTYAVTLSPAPTSYADQMGVIITVNADSSGASTLNINGLGAKPIKKANGNDVTNLKANGVYTLRYNADTGNFILQGEGASGNAVASDLLSGKTASTDAGDIVGTMTDNEAKTITPGTKNQNIPSGYHNGNGVVLGDSRLIASNIKSGTSIFGIVGSLTPLTSDYIRFKRYDITIDAGAIYDLPQHGFTQRMVYIGTSSNTFSYRTNYTPNGSWYTYEQGITIADFGSWIRFYGTNATRTYTVLIIG